MNSHTDKRRTITEFGNGRNWKRCKVIETKEDCILGKHYHKKNVEFFMLVKGKGRIKINNEHFNDMELFKEYFISTNIKHEFFLIKNSILIGLCSEKFDSNDDYV